MKIKETINLSFLTKISKYLRRLIFLKYLSWLKISTKTWNQAKVYFKKKSIELYPRTKFVLKSKIANTQSYDYKFKAFRNIFN